MAAALEARGVEVGLFAESVRGMPQRFRRCSNAISFADRDEDALIYHFSFGWPGAIDLLRRARCRRVVKYHNVTPPEFFAAFSPAFTAACEEGRGAIAALVALACDRYLADSQYNLDELIAAGLPSERGGVVPPFNRIERLLSLPADLALLDRYGRRAEPQFLMVGRLAPNKGHLHLIEGFADYRARHRAGARLIIVGKHDSRLRGYLAKVEERIAARGLRAHVVFLENARESELKAAYLCADALVIPSEHEGFCVPVVEAMAIGVPVVSGSSSALPETVGDAGLVIDSTDPAILAGALNHVVFDRALRIAMTTLGQQRYEREFSTPAIAAKLVAELGALA